MSGIVFFATEQHDAVVEFYTDRVGAEVWLEQVDCTILDFGGFRFGFCDRDHTDDCGILTFVSESKLDVDEMYDALVDVARDSPHENDTYGIYQFFADDPDGRAAEFQVFLD
ncbi:MULTISPECIES: VOC family protein [Haloferax]|uniref:VOC family protein n=1 Tax=Haloferax marinum TaxID=2666143 RepID=A0A6A8G3Z7_9EURY|nr:MULTISPECIES: VOC family protein [Haloferax]KAB1196830.1 VOC family protein [Haloferax sp. CBA1150]MRW95841.1 VOC family protein [Haloferax marinum]